MWKKHFTTSGKGKKKKFYHVSHNTPSVQVVSPIQQIVEQAKRQMEPDESMEQEVKKSKTIKRVTTKQKGQSSVRLLKYRL